MIEYDKFANKNAASARDWLAGNENAKKKSRRRPEEPTLGKCDRCKEEKLVKAYRVRRTERMDGAATYGVVVLHYCEECSPRNRRDPNAPPPPSGKEVRNLLRGAKKGLF